MFPALDLGFRERPVRAAVDEVEIHVVEIVFRRGGELLRRNAGTLRFVKDGSGTRLPGRAADTDGSEKNRPTH